MSLTHACEEWVVQGLVHTNAEVGVELQHAVEQVYAFLARAWILFSHVETLVWRKALQVTDGLGVRHIRHLVVVGSAQDVEDDGELIVLRHREAIGLYPGMSVRAQGEARLTREKWLAIKVGWRTLLHHAEQLGKDAADRPHIDGLAVVLLQENELGGTVPTRHNVTRQLTFHVLAELFSGFELLHDLGATVTN